MAAFPQRTDGMATPRRHSSPRRLLPLVWLCVAVPLALAHAQLPPPTTPPGFQDAPDSPRRASDAGLVPTEVDVQREDGGFSLRGAPDTDAGTSPRFEPPVLLTDSPAPYPEALAARPVAGTVRLELLVDEHGEMAEARLLEAGPHPLLEQAALHAATRLVFSPARVDGVAVPVRLRFEYRFEAPAPVTGGEAGALLPPITLRGLVRTKGNRQPLVGATLVSDAMPDAPVETGPDGALRGALSPGGAVRCG